MSKLTSGLWPFGHHNPISPQLGLPLAATIACGNQESFSIETYALSLIVRPYADNSEFSYTTTLYYQSIKLLQKEKKKKKMRTYERTFKRP